MSEHEPLPPLSPDLRALLDVERAAPGVPAARRDELFSRIETFAAPTLDLPPPPVSSAPTLPTTSAANTTVGTAVGKAVAGKVVAVFVAGAATGVASYGVVERAIAHDPPPAVVVRAPEPPPPPPVVVVETPAPPPPVAAPVPVAPARPAPAPRPKREPVSTDASEERALIDTARTALQRGHPEDAATLLARHRERFPRGQFDEEASALEVMALAGQHRREEAARAAKAFLARYPESLLGPAVEASVDPGN